MAQKKTLKVIFELNNGKNHTVSLLNPKNNISLADVTTWSDNVIQKSFIMKNNSAVASLADAYIDVTERVNLS